MSAVQWHLSIIESEKVTKRVTSTNVLWIRYCIREMALQQCLAPAEAVYYFHSPGGSTCLCELAVHFATIIVCTK